jgi:zinc protease
VALTSGLTVEDVEAWPDVLAAVTIDEVMEEARRLFTETRSVTGLPDAARGGRKQRGRRIREVTQ